MLIYTSEATNDIKEDKKNKQVLDVKPVDQIDGISFKIQGSSNNEEYLRIMRK